MVQPRFDSRPLALRRAYTATMRATVVLQFRDQLNHGLHLFFAIGASVIAKSVANQQLLDAVGPHILGKLYIAVALVAGVTVAGVGWLVRNRDTRSMVGIAHLVVALTMGFAFVLPAKNHWAAIAKYIVMETNSTLLLLVFGLMLGASLGPRDARKAAARVGAGGILGGLVGGAVLSLGAPLLGSRTLFLVAAAFALAPVFFLPEAHAMSRRTMQADLKRDRGDVPALKPYGIWVAITTLLMVGATTIVDYQFRHVSAQRYDADEMTAFFGVVIIAAGGATVLFQVTLLDRILDRFGLFPTALVMPGALILASAGFGVLPTVGTMAILKIVDSSSNMSVQQATGGLLLAPLGTRARAVWQGRIDGFARRGGQAIMGLFLALYAIRMEQTGGSSDISPTRLVPVALIICALWILAVLMTRGRYVKLLTAMLSAPTAREPEVQVYDGGTIRLLLEELADADASRARVILDLLESAGHRAPDALLDRLANSDESGDGALLVIDHLSSLGDTKGLRQFARNPNSTVAGAALLALDEVDPAASERLGRELLVNDDTPQELKALSAGLMSDHDADARIIAIRAVKSPAQPTRMAAAQSLSRLHAGAPPDVGQALCALAEDKETDVARVALGALGRHLSPEACNVCIRALKRQALRGAAMRALADLGSPIISPVAIELRKHLDDPLIAEALTWALGQIGSAAAVAPLIEALSAPHATVRLSAAVALTALRRRRPNLSLPHEQIAALYVPEIAFHGLMREARLSGMPNSPAGTVLRHTLKQRSQASLETLFRLMSLRYPEDSIQGAFQALVARERGQRQLALELLDTLLEADVSQALAASIGEGAGRRRASRTRNQIVRDLVELGDHFIEGLGRIVLRELGERVPDKGEGMTSANIDQILELQSLALFSQASAEDLSEVASLISERRVPKGTVLFREGEPGDAMYLIREGSVSLSRKHHTVDRLTEGDAVGIVSLLDRLPRELTATTASNCDLMILRAGDLQQLLADRPLLMHSIFRALTTSIRGQLDRVALGKKSRE